MFFLLISCITGSLKMMYQHHYSDKQKDFCDSQRFRYQFKADLALVPNVYVVNDNKLILYQFMYIMHTMLIVCF